MIVRNNGQGPVVSPSQRKQCLRPPAGGGGRGGLADRVGKSTDRAPTDLSFRLRQAICFGGCSFDLGQAWDPTEHELNGQLL